jgi:hypothetical protein
MMNTALAQLRAKTDRELAVVIRRELQRSMALAARGHYIEAARSNSRAKGWLMVANLPAQERTRLERLITLPASACA